MARLRTDVACLVALASACALALACPAPAAAGTAAAAAAQPFFGMTVNTAFRDGRLRGNRTDAALRLLADTGITVGRTDAFWHWVEPWEPRNGRHRWEWEKTDTIAEALARRGIRWQPALTYSNLWSTTSSVTVNSPPKSDADYAAYVEAVVRRYGRNGSFWAAHPELPRLPAVAYEVWNEPNGWWFWYPQPDPARYASLLRAASDAIRRADPQATVVFGGLVPEGAGDFVKAAFAARPDLRGRVDAFGLHPYGDRAERVVAHVRDLRRALDDIGLADAPIHVTEIGWPSQGDGPMAASVSALPDETRGANLSLAAEALVQSDCDVRSYQPYTWVSEERDENYDAQWMGILDHDGSLSETAAALEASAARYAGRAAEMAAGVSPARPLRLCDRADRDEAASPLRISLTVTPRRDGERRCHDARVTLRGRPLHYVSVSFDYEAVGLKSGRIAAERTKKLRTANDGTTSYCLTVPSDTGLRRTMTVLADIPRIARSSEVEVTVK